MKIDEIGIPTTEIEADGFITRAETLERINAGRAKPASECAYPNCERCDNYHGHYCTVPMVVSKQNFRLTAERISKIENELMELKCLVTAEVLGAKGADKGTLREDVNYTWADYFDRDDK